MISRASRCQPPFLLAIALLAFAASCGEGLGVLTDPSKNDSEQEGFRRGVGGGSVIKDLFPGDRFRRDTPSVDAARSLASSLPDAQLVEIADAGHVVNLEASAAFDAAVLRWLASLPDLPDVGDRDVPAAPETA